MKIDLYILEESDPLAQCVQVSVFDRQATEPALTCLCHTEEFPYLMNLILSWFREVRLSELEEESDDHTYTSAQLNLFGPN